jgi:glyoxylase-like metal-dependent hydrolase (beta-lactamase superfamily II)
MTLRLYALTCGWMTLPLGALLEGEAGELRIPVPCYLIEHPRRGRALFDAGLSTVCQSSAHTAEYLGRFASLLRIEFAAGEDVARRLEKLDVGASGIDYLINSHLHFDHAGGNALIPDARLVVQRREWQAAHEPDLIESVGYKPVDYDLGQDVLQIDGEHDLFGDGSAVLFPTYGHTPGHQSLRVRLAGGEVVLAGDACYLRRSLAELHLPMGAHDRAAMRESLLRLRELQASGARIFYGHDPEFWRGVPQAPREIA